MLSFRISTAAAILAASMIGSAGAAYFITRASLTTNVALSCPSAPSRQAGQFIPFGRPLKTTGNPSY